MTFEERGAGAKDYGGKIGDLLFAKLAAKDGIFMVERNDLKKVLEELELSLSGAAKPAEAVRVGQLTGAKLLLTGSVIHADKKLYLVARLIGTETGRVVAATVEHPNPVKLIDPGREHDQRGVRVNPAGEPVATADRVDQSKRLAVHVDHDHVGLLD